MSMSVIRDKLIKMYSDMVEKYKDAEEYVIDEMSGCFHEDMDELEKECNKYIEDFKKLFAEEYAKTPTPNHPIPIDTQLYIEELERKVKEKDWIPCSEKLFPDEVNKYYNITYNLMGVSGNYTTETYLSELANGDKKWELQEENKYVNVIAWKEKDIPYQPKGDEENE